MEDEKMPGACGSARRPSPDPCEIRAEIKNRNGKPRWWCSTHGAGACGAGGERLAECAGAGIPALSGDDRLQLDPVRYPGGVALWGALSPIYNTGPETDTDGIHVHARHLPGGDKVIDGTFAEVEILTEDGWRTVDAPSAKAFVVASIFDLRPKALRCPRCGEVHLDVEEFAVEAHRKHQCNGCGRPFYDPSGELSISNPCAELRTLVGGAQTMLPSTKSLQLRQAEFGGLAIWGSNPAIVWTSGQPEDTGIHVHAWDHDGRQVVDDTFGSVDVDGIDLDPEQVRMLMVQRSLNFLRGRIQHLVCGTCGAEHFDGDVGGLTSTEVHRCDGCGSELRSRGRLRKVVANPVVHVLGELHRRRPQEAERRRSA